MVFEGTTGWMNVFAVSIPNKERVIFELEMNFLEIFCCRSNLSNNDIISQTPCLKTGMDFRGQVWKRACEKWHFLVWGRVRLWEEIATKWNNHSFVTNSDECVRGVLQTSVVNFERLFEWTIFRRRKTPLQFVSVFINFVHPCVLLYLAHWAL